MVAASLQTFLFDLNGFPVSAAPVSSTSASTARYRPPDSSVPVDERPFMFYSVPALPQLMLAGLREFFATSLQTPIDPGDIPANYRSLSRQASRVSLQCSKAEVEALYGGLPQIACDCREAFMPSSARCTQQRQRTFNSVNVRPDASLWIANQAIVIIEAKTGVAFDAHAVEVGGLFAEEFLGWNGVSDVTGGQAIFLKARNDQ